MKIDNFLLSTVHVSIRFPKKRLILGNSRLPIKVPWIQRTVLILFFDLINMYSHAMETAFKITKHGSTHAELCYSCMVCDAWCTMQPEDTMHGKWYTFDDSTRYTICLQNSTMHGVQKKLVCFGGDYWIMLFSSQKKMPHSQKNMQIDQSNSPYSLFILWTTQVWLRFKVGSLKPL